MSLTRTVLTQYQHSKRRGGHIFLSSYTRQLASLSIRLTKIQITTKHWMTLWTNLWIKSLKWFNSSDSAHSRLGLTRLVWIQQSLSTKPSALCFTVAVELRFRFLPSETFTTLQISVDAQQLDRNLYPRRCEAACICGCQTRVTSAATKLECFGNVGQMLPGAEWVAVAWDSRSFLWNIGLFICFAKEKKRRSLQRKDTGCQALQIPIDWLTCRLDWQLLAHKGTFGMIGSFL